jgi:hypothetical protein
MTVEHYNNCGIGYPLTSEKVTLLLSDTIDFQQMERRKELLLFHPWSCKQSLPCRHDQLSMCTPLEASNNDIGRVGWVGFVSPSASTSCDNYGCRSKFDICPTINLSYILFRRKLIQHHISKVLIELRKGG